MMTPSSFSILGLHNVVLTASDCVAFVDSQLFSLLFETWEVANNNHHLETSFSIIAILALLNSGWSGSHVTAILPSLGNGLPEPQIIVSVVKSSFRASRWLLLDVMFMSHRLYFLSFGSFFNYFLHRSFRLLNYVIYKVPSEHIWVLTAWYWVKAIWNLTGNCLLICCPWPSESISVWERKLIIGHRSINGNVLRLLTAVILLLMYL